MVLTVMGVLASVNCYTMRVNLSVTLVVMVPDAHDDSNDSACVALAQQHGGVAQPRLQALTARDLEVLLPIDGTDRR